MSYRFTYGSEVTFVNDSLPKPTTTFVQDYHSDDNYIHDDDELEFAETMSLDSAERASNRKLYLRNKAVRVQFSPTLLKKENLTLPSHAITLHLLAEFNRILPHPGPIFRLSLPSRAEFIYNLTSLPILPPLKCFVQYSTDDLSCLYQSLIDSFRRELLKFNLSPRNEVHIEWMLRVRGFNLSYGIKHLVDENYEYNIAQQPLDAVIHNFFHLKRSFPGHFDYHFLSKIPITSFPLLWATIYNEFYTFLSKSDKLNTDDVAYWLNYARGYVDSSQCIAFKQFNPFSPPQFFDDEFVSPITHLFYFYSKFLSDPTKRPPMSSVRHLFAIGAALQQLTEHRTTLDTGTFLTGL